MVLCDTNIFISAFNGRLETINQLEKIGLTEIVLSAVTVMELFQGMGNKKELAQMKKKIKMYPQEKWEMGLTNAAEVWNGRLAMLGFIGVIVEIYTGRGPLHLFGIL